MTILYNRDMKGKEMKKFRLLYDGFDLDPQLRFDSEQEARDYIKANSPQIWRRCQYQINVSECKNGKA